MYVICITLYFVSFNSNVFTVMILLFVLLALAHGAMLSYLFSNLTVNFLRAFFVLILQSVFSSILKLYGLELVSEPLQVSILFS